MYFQGVLADVETARRLQLLLARQLHHQRGGRDLRVLELAVPEDLPERGQGLLALGTQGLVAHSVVVGHAPIMPQPHNCLDQDVLPTDLDVRTPVSYTHLTLPTIYSV